MVRDVERDADDDGREIEAFSPEDAAEKILGLWFSEREYYDRNNDQVRIGVRELSEREIRVGFDIEEPEHHELVYEVTWRLEPVFTAEIERFSHPLKPPRCVYCNRRVDAHPEGTAFSRRCPFHEATSDNHSIEHGT